MKHNIDDIIAIIKGKLLEMDTHEEKKFTVKTSLCNDEYSIEEN